MTIPTPSQIDAARRRLLEQRRLDLLALANGQFNLMTSASEPMREDLTQRRDAVLMGTGGRTRFGTAGYIEEVAGFAQQEGFDLIIADFYGEYTDGQAEELGPHVSSISIPRDNGNPWVEDIGQSGVDGQLSIPPRLDVNELRRRLRQAQEERGRRLAAAGTPINFPSPGTQVAGEDLGSTRISFGLATGRQMRLDLGYLERGNVLVGTRNGDRPYAIVGADSVAASRVSIEIGFEALGIDKGLLTDEMVMVAISKDVGVARVDLIEVEQPTMFHIDMAMTPWTPGVVLLNDMPAVFRLLRQTHGGDISLVGEAPLDQAERLVQQALSRAGLRVVRVPGLYPRFRWTGVAQRGRRRISNGTKTYNFFNGEGGRGGSNSSYYWITQEGPAQYLQAFVSAIRTAGVPVPRIHLVSDEFAQASLAVGQGGINCRIVPIPALR